MARHSKLNAPRTVTVGTTATLASDGTTPWERRSFRNVSASVTAFWGTSTVTATGGSKGRELKAGEEVEIDYTTDPIYMITASGTAEISVVEVG